MLKAHDPFLNVIMFLSSPVPDAGGEDKTTGASIAGSHRECFIRGIRGSQDFWEPQRQLGCTPPSWGGCRRESLR